MRAQLRNDVAQRDAGRDQQEFTGDKVEAGSGHDACEGPLQRHGRKVGADVLQAIDELFSGFASVELLEQSSSGTIEFGI